MILQKYQDLKNYAPKPLVTRFAPSPTGELHFGHLVSALYVWGIAQSLGAKVCLRIEDHDQERFKKKYEDSILEDLDWLGFLSREETLPVVRQRDNKDRYQRYFDRLNDLGLVYPCFCSRPEIRLRKKQEGEELSYDGFCFKQQVKKDSAHSYRLRVLSQEESFEDVLLGSFSQKIQEQCGDFSLKDRKGFWTYQFSNVVDDLEEDVNLVIRGLDLLSSTGRQIYLRKALGSKREFFYFHHPLILDQNGEKLSKSEGAFPLSYYRKKGFRAQEILGDAAFKAGLLFEFEELELSSLGELMEGYFLRNS